MRVRGIGAIEAIKHSGEYLRIVRHQAASQSAIWLQDDKNVIFDSSF
jgi:hypothetical protein